MNQLQETPYGRFTLDPAGEFCDTYNTMLERLDIGAPVQSVDGVQGRLWTGVLRLPTDELREWALPPKARNSLSLIKYAGRGAIYVASNFPTAHYHDMAAVDIEANGAAPNDHGLEHLRNLEQFVGMSRYDATLTRLYADKLNEANAGVATLDLLVAQEAELPVVQLSK